MDEIRFQEVLHDHNVALATLFNLEINTSESRLIKINLWRNTGFEPLQKLCKIFLADLGFSAEIKLSGFDSSLNIMSRVGEADLDFFLVDIRKISEENAYNLLEMRIQELLTMGASRISVALLSEKNTELLEPVWEKLRTIHSCVKLTYLNLEVSEVVLAPFIDERLESISGSPLSKKWYVAVARKIAVDCIAKHFLPQTKLIAVDFDNTLIDGVIGEDSLSELKQDDFKKVLVQKLKLAKDYGVLIALVSRNTQEDVLRVIRDRNEFGITEDLFDFYYCKWEPKEFLISELIRLTNLGEESCIFIDDNPVELLRVKSAFPKMNFVQANLNNSTLSALESKLQFLNKEPAQEQSVIRVNDIKANVLRESLFREHGKNSALEQLESKLTFFTLDDSFVNRAFELSNKTNQFNLTFSRFTVEDIKSFIGNNDYSVVLCNLTDIIADSGLVSLLVLKAVDGCPVEIIEFAISCRAIGRGLEGQIFWGSVQLALPIQKDQLGIFVMPVTGPRNQPATQWLEETASKSEFGLYWMKNAENSESG